MNRILTQFTKYKDHFDLIGRSGDVVIYRRSYQGRPFNWEVMIVRERNERELHGRTIPASEHLTGTTEWGS